jgi:hypothetical protein
MIYKKLFKINFLMHLTAKFAKKYNAMNAEKYKIQGQKSLRPLRNLCGLCGFVFLFFIILNSF